jgi:hypothetical protein
MIIEFRVQNHRSFREEQTFNLAASNYDKTLPQNLITPGLPGGFADLRIIKAAALYGPNAGGKTNVLLALRFLRWLVVESATGQKPEAKLPAEPFRLDHESLDAPTALQLTFVANDMVYELAVAVTKQRVVQERLVAYSDSGRAQLWYDRLWNDETRRYDWLPEKPTDFQRDPGIVEKTRENALFLSTAAQWNNTQVMPVYHWFSKKLQFMTLSADAPLSHDFTAEMVNRSGEYKEFITRVLRLADLGLTEVEARAESPDDDAQKVFGIMKSFIREAGGPGNMFPERFWQVTFQHEGKGGERFPINWGDESAGTRRFFSVLGPWLTVFKNDQVLCVDELETSLHPILAAELLRLLFKVTNAQSRAQLLFTTHNPLLLDMTLLRRDQIWFADKNRQGESFLYPLTDYKPRADESLVRGYLSGRYGAVPFIPDGLVNPPLEEGKPTEIKHAS